MESWVVALLIGVVVGAVPVAGFYLFRYRIATNQMLLAQQQAEALLAETEAKRKDILLEAKDEALRIRAAAEAEHRERRLELQRLERRLQQKEENFDRKLEALERKERALTTREKEIEAKQEELAELKREEMRTLERISQLTSEEARELILRRVESEVAQEAARRAREVEARVREDAEQRARKVVALAIQRYSSDQVAESTITVVPIPNEEMKGRIIGREGRNIRALEAATGVDLIIDETPDAVTLSGFDPVRREIARVALNKLILDGRIHPARIEEVVAKARQEVENTIRQEGEAAAYEAGVHGLHPELIKLLGRMKFRTSYGQNQLRHSVEVAHIGAMIAHELGADVTTVRRACLLHDIGKAASHEVEGPHHIVGADLARRYGESPSVVKAISGHHDEDVETQSVEAIIVQAADAISGARPGARRETVEHYIKRLEELERVAYSFEGVDKAFAIQAGREVRIIVKPDQVDDLGAVRLARDIVRRIEATLQYPGQVKVTVVRETRAVDVAR